MLSLQPPFSLQRKIMSTQLIDCSTSYHKPVAGSNSAKFYPRSTVTLPKSFSNSALDSMKSSETDPMPVVGSLPDLSLLLNDGVRHRKPRNGFECNWTMDVHSKQPYNGSVSKPSVNQHTVMPAAISTTKSATELVLNPPIDQNSATRSVSKLPECDLCAESRQKESVTAPPTTPPSPAVRSRRKNSSMTPVLPDLELMAQLRMEDELKGDTKSTISSPIQIQIDLVDKCKTALNGHEDYLRDHDATDKIPPLAQCKSIQISFLTKIP